MRWLVIGGLLCAALALSVHTVVAQPKSGPAAVLEQEARTTPDPAWLLVTPFAGVGWFGTVHSPVYFSWRPGDPAAVFYLPSPHGGSVCPLRSCYSATVGYRWPDPDPTHTLTVLTLPPGLPFLSAAAPGDPVTLVPGPGGTLRWLVP